MEVGEAVVGFIESSHLLAILEINLVRGNYLQHGWIDALLYLVVIPQNRIPR